MKTMKTSGWDYRQGMEVKTFLLKSLKIQDLIKKNSDQKAKKSQNQSCFSENINGSLGNSIKFKPGSKKTFCVSYT